LRTAHAVQVIPVPIEFAEDSAEFDARDTVFIKSAAHRLMERGVPKLVVVEGYVDGGSYRKKRAEELARLSQSRAEHVAHLLQSQSGLPADRFRSFGRDLSRTDPNRQWNQSTVIVTVYHQGDAVDALGEPPVSDTRLQRPMIWAEVPGPRKKLSLTFNNVEIGEVFNMLSRDQRMNILLAEGVTGSVSINLYDVDAEQAVYAIADAAGFAVERRKGAYVVMKRADAGKYATDAITEVRAFKLRHSDPQPVADALRKHLSGYGKLSIIPARRQIVVEDIPEFMARIKALIAEVDVQPAQFLIEAQILEITLNQNETYGVDWAKVFDYKGGAFSAGTPGTPELTQSFGLPSKLVNPFGGALVFSYLNPNLRVFLKALGDEERVRTLSTPKLLTLEDEEADVLVGNRIGYRTTVTINQVTTENIEFLESGVRLSVKPTLVGDNKILLKIHPEVSAGTLTGGKSQLPKQDTTAVTTQLVAMDGETVFIGGLIKNVDSKGKVGIPGLSDIPLFGRLFSTSTKSTVNTETIVLITPRIVSPGAASAYERELTQVEQVE
jgi:type II secretory pathway component GspD/PulD (secretin)